LKLRKEDILTKYRRLAKMTPASCLSAVVDWLLSELELQASEAKIRIVENRLWLEFLNVSSVLSTHADDDVIPALRGVLWSRVPQDMEARLTNDVLLLHLHASDPTPIITWESNVTTTETRGCWGLVALFPTSEGIEARSIGRISEPWGTTYQWPFADAQS
jgi:hypothetical protein